MIAFLLFLLLIGLLFGGGGVAFVIVAPIAILFVAALYNMVTDDR